MSNSKYKRWIDCKGNIRGYNRYITEWDKYDIGNKNMNESEIMEWVIRMGDEWDGMWINDYNRNVINNSPGLRLLFEMKEE